MFGIKNNGDVPRPRMKTSQKLHTAVSMLALTVIALTTATYAWFTLSASTRVKDLEIDVTAGANLKIATRDLGDDIEEYFDEVVGTGAASGSDEQKYAEIDTWMKNSKYNVSVEDIQLAPRTSSDGENFYTETGTTPDNNPNLTAGSYMEFELWLIASDDMRVHLSREEDGDGVYTHIWPTVNSAGKTIEDIDQCIRIAFESTDESGKNRLIIWEPNKEEDGVTPAFHKTAHTAWRNGSAVETVDLEAGSSPYSDDTWICELEANTQKLVTVRVWLEGEDPSGIDTVQKARFAMELRFQGTDEHNNPIS